MQIISGHFFRVVGPADNFVEIKVTIAGYYITLSLDLPALTPASREIGVAT